MPGLTLQIGTVTLSDFEIPSDFGPLGGKIINVKHEFPGGYITQQNLGAFPLPVKWDGYLTGPDAAARQQQLDRLRATSTDIVLSYGQYSWLGRVIDFQAQAKHQFLFTYTITFEPTVDQSGINQSGLSTPTDDQNLADETTGLGDVQSGVSGLAFPAGLATVATALSSAILTGLAAGNGTVASLSEDSIVAITAAATAAQAAAAPLTAMSDATQASPAIDFANYAANIAATVNAPSQPVQTLRMINPNLFSLAQQYFGTTDAWTDIATASGLSDPQPIGYYTITIPNERSQPTTPLPAGLASTVPSTQKTPTYLLVGPNQFLDVTQPGV